MADRNEIMKALRKAHNSGDTAAATRLAAMLKNSQAQPVVSEAALYSPETAGNFTQPSGRTEGTAMNPVVGDPTWISGAVDVARDNILGIDNGIMSTGEKIGTALNMGGESLTLGVVGDEAAAGADALMGRGSFDERLAIRREQEAQFQRLNPKTAFAARIAPALIPGIGAGKFIGGAASLGGGALRSAAVGAGSGATYGFAEGEGGVEERLEDGLKHGAVGAVIGGVIPYGGAGLRALTGGGQRAANRAMAEAVETVDDLKAMATAKYDEAAQLGVTASQARTTQLATSIGDIAKREGLITPTGRVAGSFPKISDALNMVDDFAKGTMTPAQMQSVRRTFQAAAGSADGAEKRLGAIMLRKFDDFTATLAPQFRAANKLYSRAMNGALVDEAVELAGVRAGQFSGSGFENALRTEFRRLSRDIVKGRLRGLTVDQSNSIKRIASGGSVENFMRNLGKAAPTGVVSAGIGGGMPFLIGNALGGPAVGAAAGVATLGAGSAARSAATSMQHQNANVAGALMRSETGNLPQIAAVPFANLLGSASGGSPAAILEVQRRLQGTAGR